MSSARLMEWMHAESLRLHQRGHSWLAAELVRLQSYNTFPLLEEYLSGLDVLRSRCREVEELHWAHLLRYLRARTLAFPLDRPGDAMDDLVRLNAQVLQGSLRGGTLQWLCQLELLRAYHKMDAPGYRDPLVSGLRELWPLFAGDPGPRVELLDVFWRTGFWCGDASLMREGLQLACSEGELTQGTWPYWEARALLLDKQPAAALERLQELLSQVVADPVGDGIWEMYVAVELAHAQGVLGDLDGALLRLTELEERAELSQDPMLLWDLARVQGLLFRRRGAPREEMAAWQQGCDVLRGLGLDRLRAEFALNLGEAGRQAQDSSAVARAGQELRDVWPRLRSRGDLEERARSFLE
jgi:hypothetical protein